MSIKIGDKVIWTCPSGKEIKAMVKRKITERTVQIIEFDTGGIRWVGVETLSKKGEKDGIGN